LTLKAQVLTETEKEVGRFKACERVTVTARQRPASDARSRSWIVTSSRSRERFSVPGLGCVPSARGPA